MDCINIGSSLKKKPCICFPKKKKKKWFLRCKLFFYSHFCIPGIFKSIINFNQAPIILTGHHQIIVSDIFTSSPTLKTKPKDYSTRKHCSGILITVQMTLKRLNSIWIPHKYFLMCSLRINKVYYSCNTW